MNKKYLNAILFGAMALSTVAFTGCKDYDDDIDALNERVDAVEQSISALRQEFGTLAYVSGVTYDDATRKLTVTTKGGTTQTYTISDADTKPGVDTNTQYELKYTVNGNKTTITLYEKGTSTSCGEVTITDTDTQNEEFDPSKLFVNDENKVCYGNPNGEFTVTSIVIPTVPTTDPNAATMTAIKDESGTVIGYTITSAAGSTTLMINDALPITSFEYIPEKILEGWGERVIVFNKDSYKEMEIKADEVVKKKDSQGNTITNYLPNEANPRYHVNPASATVDQLADGGKAEVLNAEVEKVSRAADGVITWKSTKLVEDGIFQVTLDADPAGLAAEETKLDEIALQFTTTGGEVFTTEYVGVINSSKELNLVLADKDLTKTDAKNADCHFATKKADAESQVAKVGEDNKATAETVHLVQQILYSDAVKGDFDLTTLVTACNYDETEATHAFYDFKNDDNLTLSFELVAYNVENTPQERYAKLSGDNKNIFTAINYDLTQSKSCIGKAPIVLAKLKDESNEALMAAAYIKLLIVGDEAAPADANIYITKEETTGIGCNTSGWKWATTDEFMSTEVYTFSHKAEGSNLDQLSKEQFHLIYSLAEEVSSENGKDYTDGTVIYDGSETKFVGDWNIKENINNEDGKSNHQVTFTLTTKPLAAKTYKAYAVYTKTTDESKLSKVVNNNMYPEKVVIVYEVKVDDIDFKANIKAGNKISNYWDGNNIDIYCETPGETHTAQIAQDMLTNFEGHKVVFEYSSNFDATKYPSFKAEGMDYKFIFSKDNEYDKRGYVKDVDGNEYKLIVKDETKLYAVAKGASTTVTDDDLVASLDGDNQEKITYADTDVAKALLNVAKRGASNAFYATLEVVYYNGCDMEVPVTDGKYNARFIRPVNAEANDSQRFTDGNNEGECKLNLAELVSFTDWRNESPLNSFAAHPDYYGYYEIASIKLDEDGVVKTNLNRDANTFVDIKEIFGETGAATLLTFESETISDFSSITTVPNYGTVTYKNKDVEVKTAFKLQIPLVITYKWGTIKETITVEVSTTL